jgi:peptidoglycan/xylan/chitin deacetylase (PgdA/CDA1 family)
MLMPLCGETIFSRPDLSGDNSLLFMAEHRDSYGRGNFRVLVKTSLETDETLLLTHYPEKHFYSDEGRELFLWNRFGLFAFGRTDKALPDRIDIYPSFEKGDKVQLGKPAPVSISPDGKYILYYREIDWCTGDLLIYDREKSYSRLIASPVNLDYDGNSIRWSGDSRFFAYVKGGDLFYFPMEKFLEDRLPSEETRRLGQGGAGSFKWGDDNTLYFIENDEVLAVPSDEMFALSFYDSPLHIGTVAGQLFFDFNPNFDNFWISPDKRHLLIQREEGALFVVNLDFRNYNKLGEIQRFPFLNLPVGMGVKKVLWTDKGKLIVLVGSELRSDEGNELYVYDPASNLDSFQETNQKMVVDIAMDREQKRISILYPDELTVRDVDRWSLLRSVATGENLACYWADDRDIILLGKEKSSLYNIITDKKDVLFFSQCDDYGFSLDGKIQISSGDSNYLLDEDNSRWEETGDTFFRETSLFNQDYRVFLTENNHPVLYSNLLMVRKTSGFGTEPLFTDLEALPSVIPAADQSGESSVFFNNGERTGRREVSLVFNISSGTAGMMDVLNDLAEYGIRATFFVNGDCIRKYPNAVRALALAGHELGSLFYTVMDMTDRRYNIDKDFIMRGLARNEDDFFRATGKELLPLWHAPWYFVNSEIVAASEEMNYTYIGRDLETLDWVDRGDDFLYYGADEIIRGIQEQVKPGSIIPVTIGSEFDREDYVFKKLELLLNGLIKDGYEIVPVGLLMEHAK